VSGFILIPLKDSFLIIAPYQAVAIDKKVERINQVAKILSTTNTKASKSIPSESWYLPKMRLEQSKTNLAQRLSDSITKSIGVSSMALGGVFLIVSPYQARRINRI